MNRQVALAAAVALIVVVSGGSGHTQNAPQLPEVSIRVPDDVPVEKVQVQYAQFGHFGAYDSNIVRKSDHLVQIQAAAGSKRAEQIKMFVWAPGCRIATFDIPVQEFSDTQESFECTPLPTVRLTGRIRDSRAYGQESVEVRVEYAAFWACRFFGFTDCAVPQISLGTAKPDAEGVFEIDLPDFGIDPITAESDCGAELEFVLREAKTGNIIAFLEPELDTLRSPGCGLKISFANPQNVTFVARSNN